MIIGLQVLGIIFGLAMLYFTFFYYKRKDFSVTDLFLWGGIWVAFLYGVILPETLDVFLQTFRVQGAMHLFTIAGFMFLFAIVFYLYKAQKKNEKRLETFVRKIAKK
jgi:hypothetical protein